MMLSTRLTATVLRNRPAWTLLSQNQVLLAASSVPCNSLHTGRAGQVKDSAQSPFTLVNTIDRSFPIGVSSVQQSSAVDLASSLVFGRVGVPNFTPSIVSEATEETLYMDSVLRKRRRKMNKHKLQKRRKLERRANKR